MWVCRLELESQRSISERNTRRKQWSIFCWVWHSHLRMGIKWKTHLNAYGTHNSTHCLNLYQFCSLQEKSGPPFVFPNLGIGQGTFSIFSEVELQHRHISAVGHKVGPDIILTNLDILTSSMQSTGELHVQSTVQLHGYLSRSKSQYKIQLRAWSGECYHTTQRYAASL